MGIKTCAQHQPETESEVGKQKKLYQNTALTCVSCDRVKHCVGPCCVGHDSDCDASCHDSVSDCGCVSGGDFLCHVLTGIGENTREMLAAAWKLVMLLVVILSSFHSPRVEAVWVGLQKEQCCTN